MTDPNGLLYMRARYYNPFLCRFINADPSGFSGGLNFYAYANGNPVSYTDPFGLGALSDNTINSSWVGTSDNSVPNMVMSIAPNVNTGPQMGPPGFTPAAPYYDPSLPSTMSVYSPGDVAFQQNLQFGLQMVGMAGQVAMSAAIGMLTDGLGDLPLAGGEESSLLYHYTSAPESSFANGLWEGSSVTDTLYTDPVQASQELGIPLPNKMIPIQNTGQFVPNTPSVVQQTDRFLGGGNDFVNPQRVPPSQLLPAQPIGGN